MPYISSAKVAEAAACIQKMVVECERLMESHDDLLAKLEYVLANVTLDRSETFAITSTVERARRLKEMS